MGISRSATVVCAYLIATSDMRAAEAIAHTQIKRRIVCPNLGFRKQLEVYARQLGKQPKQETSKAKGGFTERIRQLKIGHVAFVP